MNNTRYEKLFPNSGDKAGAFDKIAEMFYDKNFSSATKTEIELLMFSIYMDATIESCKKGNNTIDCNECSDYEMGKELGIPQEKVRTLKVKKQARYPIEFDWRESLKSIQDDIRYDRTKEKIIIPTRDPNLYNEIRNFIEDHGGYIEVQRSGNLIQIRPEHFFMLVYEELDNEGKKECRKKLVKQLQKKKKNNTIPEAKNAIDVLKLAEKALSLGIGIGADIPMVLASPLWTVFTTALQQ